MKKKERSLRVEFRYNGSELRADVCEACIDEREEIKAIHMKAPNPVFSAQVNCISAGVCENFKKPGKDIGINCGHVVANMDGELYCRRAHPGNLRIYRERYAIPPSRRQLTKMITEMLPLYKKFADLSPLLAKETSVGPRDISTFPDTVEYEIKEFPIKENTVTLPLGAHIVKTEYHAVTVMVPVEKKEETEEVSKIEGDLYSACPDCGSMDTKHIGSSRDPTYICKKCGNTFIPELFKKENEEKCL